jgi:hypothetical protein
VTQPDGWVVLHGVQAPDRAGQAVGQGLMGGIGFGILDLALLLPGLLLSALGALIGGASRRWAGSRPVEANFDLGVIRRGARSAPFHELDFAALRVEGWREHRGLELRFGVRNGFELVAPLREGKSIPLPQATRDALARVFELSSIRMPVDRYDPKGRFARNNFPENLTREEACAVVLDPPGPDDPLPNGPQG